MKYLIVLKALSSQQAQRNYLKIYVKDRIIGTWKARNMEVLPPMKY